MSIRCTRCGTTHEDLGAPGGRLGCEICYDIFHEELTIALAKRTESVAHLGLLPTAEPQDEAIQRDLGRLQALRDRAVRDEDFETAATLRDQILDLERQAEDPSGGES